MRNKFYLSLERNDKATSELCFFVEPLIIIIIRGSFNRIQKTRVDIYNGYFQQQQNLSITTIRSLDGRLCAYKEQQKQWHNLSWRFKRVQVVNFETRCDRARFQNGQFIYIIFIYLQDYYVDDKHKVKKIVTWRPKGEKLYNLIRKQRIKSVPIKT